MRRFNEEQESLPRTDGTGMKPSCLLPLSSLLRVRMLAALVKTELSDKLQK